MPRRPPMPHYDSGHMAEVMAAPPLLVGVPSIYGGGWEWEQMYAGPPRHLDDALGDPSLSSSRHDRPRQSVSSQRGSQSRHTRPQPSLGATPETRSVSLTSKHELPPLPSVPHRPKYVEPKWVVHTSSVPSRPTLMRETKAERTSRHLRESSERSGRGRSVSPPLPSIPSDSPDPTVGHPDPARPSGLNIKPLGPRPRPRLSATPHIEQKQERNPALLSPVPRPLVGYLNDPPSPHRLSPATVRSLEALVDDDQLYTIVDRLSHADLDKDEEADSSSALALAQRQIGDRRDVRDVWEPLVGIRPQVPTTPVVETARIGSIQQLPKGSARGGRGGRVTSAKQIWLDYAAENDRIYSPQTSTSSPSGAKSRSASSTSTNIRGVYAQPRPSGMAQTRLKALIDKYDTGA